MTFVMTFVIISMYLLYILFVFFRYRSLNGEISQWITMRVVNATNLKVFRLEPDTLYEFKVLSINTYGNGNFSEVKLVRTLGRLTHGILYTQVINIKSMCSLLYIYKIIINIIESHTYTYIY
jgi:hypothetical protein